MADSDRFITSGGVPIRYRIEGSGPFVTLIHGVGADLESWDRVTEILAPRCTVLRADLRGHGKSGRITDCSIQDFVRDQLAVMDAAGFQKAHLFGFSLGGLIAQWFALEHGDRVHRLALISAVAERTAQERARVVERADRIRLEGIAAVVGAAEDRWFTPAFKAAHPDLVKRRLEQLVANDHRSYGAAYRVFGLADEGVALDRIPHKTLIFTGEHDSGSSPRMARLMHERIRNSRLEILPDLRHSLLLEAPDLVAKLLLDFMDEPN